MAGLGDFLADIDLSEPVPGTMPRRWRDMAGHAPAALVVIAAIAIRLASVTCTDVSWLLTLGERTLDGAVPYVDFIETNPPASILIYLPAVAIARLLALRPEAVVVGLVFAGAAASLALSARILAASGLRSPARDPWLAAVALFVLLILPGYAFAEREHIAVAAMLPLLAAYAGRTAGRPPGALLSVLAGIGGGIAVAIKPHFALALALPFALVLATAPLGARAWLRLLFDGAHCALAAVVVAYGILVALAFPAFPAQALPLIAAVYLPIRGSLLDMIGNPGSLVSAAAMLLALAAGRGRFRDATTPVLLLAACGGWAMIVIQGKGWPYHGYPAIALGLMAGAPPLLRRWQALTPQATALRFGATAALTGCFVALGGVAVQCLEVGPRFPGLIEAVGRLAPPRPKVVSIAGDLAYGHPLVRDLGGQWLEPVCSRWISEGAEIMLSRLDQADGRRAALERYARADRDALVAAIVDGRPDVVLVAEEHWKDWVARHGEVAAALVPYREVASVEGAAILMRR
ncbi:hypothetical protein [Labrys wisconsinensis]|uniref:Glycosyltransferase RgtA/B/C/D-like domain-containing protein n=1 Tax=Labrys wisconsinensis TaxID=425677 RepID=A0ABU0JDI8_9HYPH|nr:hypothetical protein [Labrys wisconsinensis]MDQ0471182.1 hypothetical protein [Labrys wisconsinensis]